MSKTRLFLAALSAAVVVQAQTFTLDYPLPVGIEVTQLTTPVVVRGANGRWMSTMCYDVRDAKIFDSAGAVSTIDRLAGKITIEIDTLEVLALLRLSPTNTYLPGEWDAKVLQAGLMKAVALIQPGAPRTQYETYWNQVLYAPVPVVPPTVDANGAPIVGWTDAGAPVIGYGEDDEPVLGVPPADANGAAILGVWKGMPVIGYDALGFPQLGVPVQE